MLNDKENEENQQKPQNEWKILTTLKDIIFYLNSNNFDQSVNFIINKFLDKYPISFNMVVSHMIFKSFSIWNNDYEIYLRLLQEIEKHEKDKKCTSEISDVFSRYLLKKRTKESYYYLNFMIDHNLIEAKIIQNMKDPFFIHYHQDILNIYHIKRFNITEKIPYEELTQNDFELHKKLIKEGHNPNELAKIIRNDEIEKLQEISSQTNFDFDQTIEPSLYEMCSFINQRNVSLIDYAAFFSSVKCFKYFLMNGANVINTGKYAVAGGNLEIIHLCEQNHSSFQNAYEAAIEFHQNDIFKYLYENKIEKTHSLEELGIKCISYHNYDILLYLKKEGMKVNEDVINFASRTGNIFLVKYFLAENEIPKDIIISSTQSGNIELIKYVINKEGIDINAKDNHGITALIIASIRGYIEIVQLLLEQKGIDVNAKYFGDTALMNATEEGHTEIVKLLLKQEGIDINTKDNFGFTVLMIAAEKGHTEIAKLLLEQEGIDINAKDNFGNTALIWAAEQCHEEIRILINSKLAKVST